MSAGHVIKEVWRGERGILYLCHLECTCSWRSDEVGDPAQLRIPRALHLDGPWADVEDEVDSDDGSWSVERDTAPIAAAISGVDSWAGHEDAPQVALLRDGILRCLP